MHQPIHTSASPTNQPAQPRQYALVGGVFVLLAIWLTYPQIRYLGTALVGGTIAQADGWQKVWNLWWVHTALTSQQDLLYSYHLFFPQGASLGFQPIDLTNALLTLPVLFTAGPLTAYGVAAILGFALSGWLGWMLALRLTHSMPAALIAGGIIAAAPQHVAHFFDGQIEHVALQWVVLFFLVLVHAAHKPTWTSGLWVAISATLVIYTNFYHALFVALASGIWLLHWLITQREQRWHSLRPLLIALPLVMLLILPLLPSVLTGKTQSSRQGQHWQAQAENFSVDAIDLLLPSANHPLWGSVVKPYQASLHPKSANWIVTPGYVALILAIVGAVTAWVESRIWAIMYLVLWGYALGPTLHIGGVATGIPLPYALINDLPIINFAYRLPQALLIGLVPLALLAGYGTRTLLAHTAGWRRVGVMAVLGGGMLLEAAPPTMTIWHDDTPPAYATLHDAPGALLVLPFQQGAVAQKSILLQAQMRHTRPIIGGYVPRLPDYPFADTPLVRQLQQLTCDPDAAHQPAAIQAIDDLPSAYGISHVVLQLDQLSPRKQRCAVYLLETVMGLEPSLVLGDDTLAIYPVPGELATTFLFADGSWFLEADGKGQTWRWMGEQGKLLLVNTGDTPRTGVVEMHMESYQHARPLALRLDDQHLGEITIQRASRVYMLPVRMDKGQHQLELSAPTDFDPPAHRAISVVLKEAILRQGGGE